MKNFLYRKCATLQEKKLLLVFFLIIFCNAFFAVNNLYFVCVLTDKNIAT